MLLTEGRPIVQYIATFKPASGLAPAAGTPERYKLQEWLNFISSEIHKSMGSMFNAGADAGVEGSGQGQRWATPRLAVHSAGKQALSDGREVSASPTATCLPC